PEHADIVDVAVVLGNNSGDLREASGLIDIVDQDARRKALRSRFIDIPAHVEPPLRLLLKVLQCWRLDRVDRDALPRRNNAHDPVSWYGAAIGRELDRQVRIDA